MLPQWKTSPRIKETHKILDPHVGKYDLPDHRKHNRNEWEEFLSKLAYLLRMEVEVAEMVVGWKHIKLIPCTSIYKLLTLTLVAQ